jgi:hypothetical protein
VGEHVDRIHIAPAGADFRVICPVIVLDVAMRCGELRRGLLMSGSGSLTHPDRLILQAEKLEDGCHIAGSSSCDIWGHDWSPGTMLNGSDSSL